MHLCYVSLLEIRYPKNLEKLKGAAVRITGNKPEGKNTMKEKNIDKNQKEKNRKVATEPCDKFTVQFLK